MHTTNMRTLTSRSSFENYDNGCVVLVESLDLFSLHIAKSGKQVLWIR